MRYAGKAIISVLVLLIHIGVAWAQCDQPVRIMQYIPVKEGGWGKPQAQKRPLSGVSLKCSDADAVKTDSEGRAVLHFRHLSVPDYVNIQQIDAPGFDIFSLEAYSLWAVNPAQEFTILLIAIEDLQRLRDSMPGFVSTSPTPRYRFYEPAERLLHTDVTQLESSQYEAFHLASQGQVGEVVARYFTDNTLIERFRQACLSHNEAEIAYCERLLDWQVQLLRLAADKESMNRANQLLVTMFEYRNCSLGFVDHYLQTCRNLCLYSTAIQFIDTQMERLDISLTGRGFFYFWRGFFEVARGEASNAIGSLEQAYSSYEALVQHMDDPELYSYRRAMTCQLLGQCYHEMHDVERMCFYHDKAIELFNIAIEHDGRRSFQWGRIAMIIADNFYYDGIRSEQVDSLTSIARAVLDREVATNPQQYSAGLMTIYGRVGARLLNQGRAKEALEYFDAVLDQTQGSSDGHDNRMVYNFASYFNMRAKAHSLLGEYETSDKELQIAIDMLNRVDRANVGSFRTTYVRLYLSKIANLIAEGRYIEAGNLANLTGSIAEQAYVDKPVDLKRIKDELVRLNAMVKPSEHLVSQIAHDGNSDLFEFGFITDTHNFGTSADIRKADVNIQHFVEYCNAHPRIRFAFHGGDFINAYDLNHDQAYWCMAKARSQFSQLNVPFYTTKGNHDCNGKQWKNNKRDNSQIITDHEYFELFNPLSKSNPKYNPEGISNDHVMPEGNFYYRDFEEHHMRVIVLNHYDRDTLEVPGIHGKQMRWLLEEAMDFSRKPKEEEWHFIVFTHVLDTQKSPVLRFFEAYQKGASEWTGTDSGIKLRWSERRQGRAQMVGIISGHMHCDVYSNQYGFNSVGISRGFATGGEVNYQDDCFDHFVVDTRRHLLFEYRQGRGQSRIFSYGVNVSNLVGEFNANNNRQTFPVTSFPSAEGMGHYATGGSGGRVLHITHLGDHGEGSLRWAVEQKGARTIVFNVGGEIRLQRPLVIDNDSISIFGQTAPKRGVVLTGYPVRIAASEVIARYLTIAPDDSLDCDAISDTDFGQRAILLDHITTGSTLRSGIAIRYAASSTVQRCRIAPSLGEHDAALVAGGYCTTYFNNYIHGSSTAVHIPDEPGCNRWVQLSANVIGNWSRASIEGGCSQAEINLIDNYFLPSERNRNDIFLETSADGTARYYLRGNVLKGKEHLASTQKGQRKLINDRAGLPYYESDTIGWYRIDPVARPHASQYGFSSSCVTIASFHNKEIFQYLTGEALYEYVQKSAGNNLDNRPLSVPADRDADGIPDGYATLYDYLSTLTDEDRR